jgi:hypothetical protein
MIYTYITDCLIRCGIGKAVMKCSLLEFGLPILLTSNIYLVRTVSSSGELSGMASMGKSCKCFPENYYFVLYMISIANLLKS